MHTEGCYKITNDDGSHYWCQCPCHKPEDIYLVDADISNPPEEVTWYPVNHPSASWNLPK